MIVISTCIICSASPVIRYPVSLRYSTILLKLSLRFHNNSPLERIHANKPAEYQNKGLGSNIISQIESIFPNVKTWSLDTPKDNRRNRHFYEKLGYKKNGETKINDWLILIEYEKNVN